MATAVAAENVQDTGLAVFAFGKKKSDSKVLNVPYNKVHADRDLNPRTKLGSLDELKGLIKNQGLLNPPTVRKSKTQEGHFLIVAGERRFRALGELGYDTIPVNYRPDLDEDDKAALAVALAENSEEGRTNLTPLDRGRSYQKLEKEGWTVKQIAKECGAHERDVRRCLDLIEAPEKVQKGLDQGKFGFVVALEIARQPEDTQQKLLSHFKEIAEPEDGPTVGEVKRLIKSLGKADENGEGEEGDGEGESPAKKKKRGKKKTAGDKVVWRGKKEVLRELEQLCHFYASSTEEERATPQFSEMRGAIGAILWQMNDAPGMILQDLDPNRDEDPAAAKKELKRIQALIEAHAEKYVAPPDQDGVETPESEEAVAV